MSLPSVRSFLFRVSVVPVNAVCQRSDCVSDTTHYHFEMYEFSFALTYHLPGTDSLRILQVIKLSEIKAEAKCLFELFKMLLT